MCGCNKARIRPRRCKAAKELGLQTVHGECILMFAGANQFHGIHCWLWKVFGKMAK